MMSKGNDTSQLPSCPEKPILKRKGFQFDGDHFSAGGIARVDGARLRGLFNPSTLRLKRDQKDAADEARRLFTKPFLAAQLKYYDIPFRPSHKRDELLLLLQNAVHQGKCDQVPQSVSDMEASLRADYAPLQQKWEADCAVWSAEKKRRDDEAFAKCKTPVERANFDLRRFVDMYFLTDGKPDKSKTPEPMALSGLRQSWQLRTMAEGIPGLHTRIAYSKPDAEFCIGWDEKEVNALADRITERAREAERALKKAKWDQQMVRHKKYLVRAAEKGRGRDKQTKPFDLDHCVGSYIIQCPAIEDGWDLGDQTLTMDICKGKANSLWAAYHFGILEGTMFFSQSEDTLKAMFGDDLSDSAESQSDQDDCADEEEGDEDEEGDNAQESTRGKKRKSGKPSPAQAIASAAAAGDSLNAKRRKTGAVPSPSRRVYFGLHGRETGEGEVLPDPDSGHIDFLSDDCATFAGLVDELTYVGTNVEFRGYKVSDTPRKKPEPWDTFCYGRYGLEIV
ncbi:hypothetical protein V8C44DRAFT_344411 [Trichoderma aethiopicum]